MRLSGRIKESTRHSIIEKFQMAYPDVYEYFNSSEFTSMFDSSNVVTLSIYKQIGTSTCVMRNESLPFRCSSGEVSLDKLITYLECERFVCDISSQGVNRGLIIKLK